MHSRLNLALFTSSIALVIGLGGCAKTKHVTRNLPATPSGSEVGIASWYGEPYHGRAAANGEIYDMEKLTAAHRTLPFDTWVRVTNLTNNKTVDVRITDRGPFIDGRIIDLSRAAARAIDLLVPGIAQVRIDIIAASVASTTTTRSVATTTTTPRSPTTSTTQSLYAIQVGVFEDRDRAERMRVSMEDQFGSARVILQQTKLWRVLVGEAANLDEANELAAKVRAKVGECVVVRLPEAIADPRP